MSYTGLRPGEALALRFADVGERTISVDKAVADGEEGPTKTNRARAVPLVPPLQFANVIEELVGEPRLSAEEQIERAREVLEIRTSEEPAELLGTLPAQPTAAADGAGPRPTACSTCRATCRSRRESHPPADPRTVSRALPRQDSSRHAGAATPTSVVLCA